MKMMLAYMDRGSIVYSSSRLVYLEMIGLITLTVAGFMSLNALLNGSAEVIWIVFSSSCSARTRISFDLSSRHVRIGMTNALRSALA